MKLSSSWGNGAVGRDSFEDVGDLQPTGGIGDPFSGSFFLVLHAEKKQGLMVTHWRGGEVYGGGESGLGCDAGCGLCHSIFHPGVFVLGVGCDFVDLDWGRGQFSDSFPERAFHGKNNAKRPDRLARA